MPDYGSPMPTTMMNTNPPGVPPDPNQTGGLGQINAQEIQQMVQALQNAGTNNQMPASMGNQAGGLSSQAQQPAMNQLLGSQPLEDKMPNIYPGLFQPPTGE